MNIYALIGTVCGILIGLVICAIVFIAGNSDGKLKSRYDERQTQVRGEAYKVGFYAYMICLTIVVLVTIAEVEIPMELPAQYITILFAGTLPMCIYSIWHNAYWGLNNKKMAYIALFIVVTIINVLVSVMACVRGEMVVDGIITVRVTNLLCAILFVVIGGTLILKSYVDKKSSDEE